MGNDFNKRLLATFAVETRERLAAIAAGLIELEKTAEEEKRQEILEAVSREAHSLKGAARAVNMAGIESLCHALETVFAALKRGTGAAFPGIVRPAPPGSRRNRPASPVSRDRSGTDRGIPGQGACPGSGTVR